MKTRIFALTLLALLLMTGATNLSGQTFSLGAKGGASISYYSNFDKMEGLIQRVPNIGIDAGFIGNVKLNNLLSLQFELLFEQKGEKYKMTIETSQTMRINMNYITLPILLEFSHSFGNFKLFGGIGPYMGYALSGKTVTPDTTAKIEFGKDKYRRFDAGATVNLGAGVKVGPGHIFLDLRYNYGFVDIVQYENKPDGYKPHYNRNFSACIGYIIPLGK